MNGLKKLLKQISLKSDIINTIGGIVLIVSLMLIFHNPKNEIAILTACASGGLINIMSGLKIMKDPKNKMTAMTFFMVGIILVVIGLYII
jgi:hypothetical protein